MPSGLRTLGMAGAVLVMVGLAILGAGYLYFGYEENQAIQCGLNHTGSGCNSAEHDLLNASTDLSILSGAGYLITGVGAGLVAIAAVRLMGLWPPRPGVASPQGPLVWPNPSAGTPASPTPPPVWSPPPGPGNPP
jgi:hypothetical protein